MILALLANSEPLLGAMLWNKAVFVPWNANENNIAVVPDWYSKTWMNECVWMCVYHSPDNHRTSGHYQGTSQRADVSNE